MMKNGYIELFNGKLRDELLNWEIFDTLFEAKVLVGHRKVEYNKIRPQKLIELAAVCPRGY